MIPDLAAERASVASRAGGLTRQLAALAEEQALNTHDDEHDPEGVTIASMRAQLRGLLDGTRRELDAIDRAEARIRTGGYGRCLVCGRPIAEARLEAVPAAETCIGCAGKLLPRQNRA